MQLSSRNLPSDILNPGTHLVPEEPTSVPDLGAIPEMTLKQAINKERQVKVPIDDPLTQDRILKLMTMENLADITLPGFAIKLIRTHGPISFKTLSEEVSKCFDALRRSDGSRYHGDFIKALKGCLSSSEVFTESEGNIWSIEETSAQQYEERTTKKIKSILSKQVRKNVKKGGKDGFSNSFLDSLNGEYEQNYKNGDMKSSAKSKDGQSQKRPSTVFDEAFEVLSMSCKAYKMEEKAEYLLQNPLKNIKLSDTPQQLAVKLGKERFIGIMQCFDYFSPIIEDYMKQKTSNNEEINPASIKNEKQDEEEIEKNLEETLEANNEEKES